MSAAVPTAPLSSIADLRVQFADDLIRTTRNFRTTTWLGHTIRQNTLDLWVIQETIAEIRPALLIECGTNHGGSALFYAHLFDLLGHGAVVTIDVQKLHTLAHPRITFLQGSSVSPAIVAQVAARVREAPGPVMVILDSDHAEAHVRAELDAYARFVTPGSYVQVQDGVIDQLPIFAADRPGPLPAIESFVRENPRFEIDHARCARFPVTHHPLGWLRRRPDPIASLVVDLAMQQRRRVAVLGTGSGALRVHEEAATRGVEIVAFLERDGRDAPPLLCGRPVRPLSALRQIEPVDALVVGSITHAEPLRAELTRAAGAAGLAVPVVAPA